MYVFLKILSSVRLEIDGAQRGPTGPAPAAMCPGSHHKCILNARILFLDMIIGLDGSQEVFGIVLSPHHQKRWFDVLQIMINGPVFPELIIGLVLHDLRPPGIASLEVKLVKILQWSDIEKK